MNQIKYFRRLQGDKITALDKESAEVLGKIRGLI